MYNKYRGFELPRFCRERHYSRLMKTWNIWLWWRGSLDLCHTICLRGQSMFMSMIHINVVLSFSEALVNVVCSLILVCSRHSEKYIRKGRLNWPEGCTSRESMKAVMKLPRLQVLYLFVCWSSHFICCEAYFYVTWAESGDAKCGSVSWGFHRPFARAAQVWSSKPHDRTGGAEAPLLHRRIWAKKMIFPATSSLFD